MGMLLRADGLDRDRDRFGRRSWVGRSLAWPRTRTSKSDAHATVSIPLIPTLALFWEKAGITRARALNMLREAITDAIADGISEDANIQVRIGDVTTAWGQKTRPGISFDKFGEKGAENPTFSVETKIRLGTALSCVIAQRAGVALSR